VQCITQVFHSICLCTFNSAAYTCNTLPDIINRITVNPKLIPSVTNITLSYSFVNVSYWLSYSNYLNDLLWGSYLISYVA
jgi:hypothetical protein